MQLYRCLQGSGSGVSRAPNSRATSGSLGQVAVNHRRSQRAIGERPGGLVLGLPGRALRSRAAGSGGGCPSLLVVASLASAAKGSRRSLPASGGLAGLVWLLGSKHGGRVSLRRPGRPRLLCLSRQGGAKLNKCLGLNCLCNLSHREQPESRCRPWGLRRRPGLPAGCFGDCVKDPGKREHGENCNDDPIRSGHWGAFGSWGITGRGEKDGRQGELPPVCAGCPRPGKGSGAASE